MVILDLAAALRPHGLFFPTFHQHKRECSWRISSCQVPLHQHPPKLVLDFGRIRLYIPGRYGESCFPGKETKPMTKTPDFPRAWFVCPLCRSQLRPHNDGVVCGGCGEVYPMVGGDIPILIPRRDMPESNHDPLMPFKQAVEIAESLKKIKGGFPDLVGACSSLRAAYHNCLAYSGSSGRDSSSNDRGRLVLSTPAGGGKLRVREVLRPRRQSFERARPTLPLDYASITSGARIHSHSTSVAPAPHSYSTLITPVMPGEDPVCHYTASLSALNEETPAWFALELARETDINRIAIDWWRAEEAGVQFTLEAWKDGQWVECLRETQGYVRLRGSEYQNGVSPSIRARLFRFTLFRAIGQNRLLIRRFSLFGGGPAPIHVLMAAPDCYNIDRRIMQQARSLVKNGYRVTLFCGFECPQEQHYVEDGIEIHRFRYDWDDERAKRIRPRIPTAFLRRLFQRVFMSLAWRVLPRSPFDEFFLHRARRFPADVIHIHDLPMLKPAVLLAREWNVPLFYDAHEIYYEEMMLDEKRKRRLRSTEVRYMPEASVFSTVNEGIAGYFRKVHGDWLQPLVLLNSAEYNGKCDPAGSRRLLHERAGIAMNRGIVLYQGILGHERNLENLVRASERFPDDAALLLMGFGDHEESLRKMVKERGLEQRVYFTGRVDTEEMRELTPGADLGVIPYQRIDTNTDFCSPNKFFEFIQARLPFLGPDFLFFQQMRTRFGEDLMAIGDTTSVEGLADGVCALLADPDRLQRMRDTCEAAASILCWEKDAEKLLAAYRHIAAPPCGGKEPCARSALEASPGMGDLGREE